MIKDYLLEFVALSDKMRNGYQDSLGIAQQSWEQKIGGINHPLPEIFRETYSRFAGTRRDIKEQAFMDFIPGYRLIHIEELQYECHALLHLLEADGIREKQIKTILPLLAGYSSDYICYVEKQDGTEAIFSYAPGSGLAEMHCPLENFFETVIAFYKEDVYFLDNNGFLDYSFEKAGTIGEKCNPGIAYWKE